VKRLKAQAYADSSPGKKLPYAKLTSLCFQAPKSFVDDEDIGETMIKYLSISLLILSLPVWGERVQVHSMEVEDTYSARFRLTTFPYPSAVLDCQSFIQGLFLGEDATGDAILLNEWECEELGIGIEESLSHSKPHCLEVDWNDRILLSHQACEGDGTK
jgi:hypothetical protein